MRVLVACEFSGVVRDAFRRRGHEAWSCDLEDVEPEGEWSNYHLFGDARWFLEDGWQWDLLIAHPPCTRLCRSGRRWLSGAGKFTPPKQLPAGRSWESMKSEFREGVQLFTDLWRAPVPRVAIENPVMHDIARDAMPADLPRPQLVQPFHFGHPAYKQTGLYLRGLPPLRETHRLAEPVKGSATWHRWCAVHRMAPSATRSADRSRTFQGIADAFADQWSCLS